MALLASATAALTTGKLAQAEAQAVALPERRLGSAGPSLPVLGLGGAHFGRIRDERTAQAVFEAALDEGIRFIDTAESYGNGRSEARLGALIQPVRDRVFLMTKSYDPSRRDRAGARRHLEGSLARLRTDHLDLWQLHSIRSVEDVDRAFAPGGAIEYMLEMKDQGVVRMIGITGHVKPEPHLRALEHFDRGLRFDTMQLPLNPIDFHQQSFQREVLPGLVERGIAVIGMKTFGDDRLISSGLCSVEECLRFVLALPVSVVVLGMETPEQVRHNARIARAAGPMEPADIERLLARIEPEADLALEWYKRG